MCPHTCSCSSSILRLAIFKGLASVHFWSPQYRQDAADDHCDARSAGLTRSLNHTIDSIKQNLIGPILKQGFEVDVFVHTYNDVRHLTNTRTGEDSDLDTDQWKLLSPYDVSLTSQDEFLELVECASP